MQTINDTLRDRTVELDEVNDFLESILTSIRAGVVVGAENLWGLRQEEARGEHLLNLDIGLPLPELRPIVRNAMSDAAFEAVLRLQAVNRRGRQVDVRVLCGSLRTPGATVQGAILVMEPE